MRNTLDILQKIVNNTKVQGAMLVGGVMIGCIGGIIFVLEKDSRGDQNKSEKQINQNTEEETTKETSGAKKIKDLSIGGDMLVVRKDGIWRIGPEGERRKHILKNQNVAGVKQISGSDKIGYVLNTKKNVVDLYDDPPEGDYRTSTRKVLMLANTNGTKPIKVFPNVYKWGNVPSSNKIWYEKGEYTFQGPNAGYELSGSGEYYLWDLEKEMKKQFLSINHKDVPSRPEAVAPSSIIRSWSPDGEKFLFSKTPRDIKVKNRITGTIRSVMKNPTDLIHDKCDEGGIIGGLGDASPTVRWSKDSTALFVLVPGTAFDGEFDKEKMNKCVQNLDNATLGDFEIKAGKINAFRVSINKDKIERIMPPLESNLYFEGKYTRNELAFFDEDFNKIFYPRWKKKREESRISLMMYDVKKEQKVTVLEEANNIRAIKNSGNTVFFLEKPNDKSGLVFKKANYITNQSKIIQTLTLPSNKGIEDLGNIEFHLHEGNEGVYLTFSKGVRDDRTLYFINSYGVRKIINSLPPRQVYTEPIVDYNLKE